MFQANDDVISVQRSSSVGLKSNYGNTNSVGRGSFQRRNFDTLSEHVSNNLRVKINKVDSAVASNDGDR